jgi:3-hydroxyacyl-[acyl-carrier-protein] dehydratase
MNDPNSSQQLPLDVRRILDLLPHRYPFLLVDRVVEFEPGRRLRALKNVTINEPFFQGHFPGHPVMPGVLIIEALAQASGLLVQLSTEVDPSQHPLFYLVKVD